MKKVYINIKGNFTDLQAMAKEHYKANIVLLKLGYQSTSIIKAPLDWMSSPANEMKHRCKALLECDLIYNPDTSKHDPMCIATRGVAIAARMEEVVWEEQIVEPLNIHTALKNTIDKIFDTAKKTQVIE